MTTDPIDDARVPISSHRDAQGKLEVDRALEAVWWLYSLGATWTPEQCDQVLQRMSVFLDRQYLDGSSTRLVSNNLLMLIWAAVGDAHRELGDIRSTVEAYQRASSFRPSCSYGDYYAEITIKHNIQEHYRTALHTLEAGTQNWSEYSGQIRLFANFLSFMRHPLSYLQHLKYGLMRKRRMRILRRRLDGINE